MKVARSPAVLFLAEAIDLANMFSSFKVCPKFRLECTVAGAHSKARLLQLKVRDVKFA